MISKKTVSALLTGASLATLALAGRAAAGTTQGFTGETVVNWVTNTSYLNIDPPADLETFTNDATIAFGVDNPDGPGSIAVHVRSGVFIDEFINSTEGVIKAHDGVPPFGGGFTDDAYATALLIDGVVPQVTNNGLIEAKALGFDLEATDDAEASARATGIANDPDGDFDEQEIINNGKVIAEARARATSVTDDADATAYATGIYQFLDSDGPTANLELTNNGKIDAYAEVEVKATDEANGWAIARGVYQEPESADALKAKTVNTNKILAEAYARIQATTDEAIATYVAAIGVDQDVFGDGAESGRAIARNSGLISASVDSKASATYTEAISNGYGVGIQQYVADAFDASAYAKNTGDIEVSVVSRAKLFAGTYAAANSTAIGINQDVGMGEPTSELDDGGSVASATAKNTGYIDVSAVSTAKGTYLGPEDVCCLFDPGTGYSDARAYGIRQVVGEAGDLSATVVNKGVIDVFARAKSEFVYGTYLAANAAATGVFQNQLFGDDATASTVNSGDIYAGSKAVSQYSGFGFESFANARANGVLQTFDDFKEGGSVYDGSAYAENAAGATIYASAESYAQGLFVGLEFSPYGPGAVASAAGIRQNVQTFFDEPGSKARAVAKNYGDITAMSYAEAEGTYEANAAAGFGGGRIDPFGPGDFGTFGIRQTAAAWDAKTRAVNTGSIYAGAEALAKADNSFLLDLNVLDVGPALANAGVTYVAGIFQDARGSFDFIMNHDEGDSEARNIAKNSGSIVADGYAKAVGGTYANAFVGGAFGVGQNAGFAFESYNELYNTGTIAASGKAVAKIDPNQLMVEEANGFYAPGFASAFGGVFGVSQNANAYLDGFSEPVFVEDEFDGYGELARNTVENSGLISASMLAKALGGGDSTAATYAFANGFAVGVAQFADGAETSYNKAKNSGMIVAESTAKSTGLFVSQAGADAAGIFQGAEGPFEDFNIFNNEEFPPAETLAKNVVNNSDWIGAYASAEALGPDGGAATYAAAYASATGVGQYAVAAWSVINKVDNSGTIYAEATALSRAWADSEADSEAVGIYQDAEGFIGGGDDRKVDPIKSTLAENSVDNSGWVEGVAVAKALGRSGGAATYASADASGTGVEQYAEDGWKNRNSVVNSGVIIGDATAKSRAWVESEAEAEAWGVYQEADGFANGLPLFSDVEDFVDAKLAKNTVNNSDWISADAVAKALGANDGAATYASASVFAAGVEQEADTARKTYNRVKNSGTIAASGEAYSEAWFAANAWGEAFGVIQEADGYLDEDRYGKLAHNVFSNSGWVGAEATAIASARNNDFATYAEASVSATGVQQETEDAWTMQSEFTNTGWIEAYGYARSKARWASAYSEAEGYETDFDDGPAGAEASATFLNDTDAVILANAYSKARGKRVALAGAYAQGIGVDVSEHGSDEPGYFGTTIDGVNKGLIYATAEAVAKANNSATYEYVQAAAVGVGFFSEGALDGKFKNTSSGMISAEAYADGDDGGALAIGIFDPSAQNEMKIVNKGFIYAYAEGPEAAATGIAIAGLFEETEEEVSKHDSDAVAQIINDGGDIWAGYSTDGGETVQRGNAINTDEGPTLNGDLAYAEAPNAVEITLSNDEPANIWGNIDITDDDTITVVDGQTNFDGIINPDEELEGTLNIFTDGKLVFLNPDVGMVGGESPFDDAGPSMAYVDVFSMNNKGTLAIEFSPDDSDGAYTMIAANEANLKGTFSAIYGNNLYGDKAYYDNVIEAGDRNGKFKELVDNSVLLKSRLIYDGDDNVDLKVKRQGFGDVSGLTKNQGAVGDGIEKVYDKVSGDGDFSELVQTLFTLDKGAYKDALDQLSGAEYAQMMQSVLWSPGALNRSVTDRMDCGLNWLPGAGSDGTRGADACFEPGKFQFWGRITGAWNDNDGDNNAPGYDENQQAYLVGGDYAVNDKLFFGLAGGYFSSDMDFDGWGGRNGASINYDGAQVALYGGWDNSKSYLRKIVSYGSYSGDSHRDVGIGMAPVDPSGSFDATVVSAYGEAGHRFAINDNTVATPFLGLGLASANLDGFTEKDPEGTGAGLKVRGADASSFASTLGVRVNGNWGAFTPELSLAWRHEFDQTTQTVNSSFASAPGGAKFSVVSSDPGADALLVGIGGTYAFSEASDLIIRYDGTFLSGYNSQQVTAPWTSKF